MNIKLNRYGKQDVSDWILEFDDETKVFINTLMSEDIEYKAGGKININIKDALIIPELLNLMRKGNNVKRVYQILKCKNAETYEIEELTFIYDNLIITSALLHGEVGECANVNINITSK